MGRQPTQMPVPASSVAATDSHRAGVAAVRSTASAPAPVARSSGSGADGAQQCTTVGPAWAASTDSTPRITTCGSTARTRPKPDDVGSDPSSTAGSDGSSTCSTTSAPGTSRRTSAT